VKACVPAFTVALQFTFGLQQHSSLYKYNTLKLHTVHTSNLLVFFDCCVLHFSEMLPVQCLNKLRTQWFCAYTHTQHLITNAFCQEENDLEWIRLQFICPTAFFFLALPFHSAFTLCVLLIAPCRRSHRLSYGQGSSFAMLFWQGGRW
jgi:hypothetical protein